MTDTQAHSIEADNFDAWLDAQPAEIQEVVNRHLEILCDKVRMMGAKGARQLLARIYLLVWTRTPRETL